MTDFVFDEDDGQRKFFENLKDNTSFYSWTNSYHFQTATMILATQAVSAYYSYSWPSHATYLTDSRY